MERNYTVYFEIYGKKLRTTVLAKNPKEAQEVIKSKIIFHKTAITEDDGFNHIMEMFKDIIK